MIARIKDVNLVPLTNEELTQVRDLLDEMRNELVKQLIERNDTLVEWDKINDLYRRVNDVKVVFGHNTFVITE